MDRELEIEHRITRVEEACAMIPKMAEQLNEMSAKFSKYEGKWGAIMLVGSGLWLVFLAGKDTILSWFKAS